MDKQKDASNFFAQEKQRLQKLYRSNQINESKKPKLLLRLQVLRELQKYLRGNVPSITTASMQEGGLYDEL